MRHEQSHLTDRELTLLAGDELPPARNASMRAHLAHCPSCQARSRDLEAALAGFVNWYRHELDAPLSPVSGPRALLRARLAEMPPPSYRNRVRNIFALPRLAPAYAIAALAMGAFLILAIGQRGFLGGPSELAAAPKPRLTPGATVPLTRADVCGGSVRQSRVPTVLERQVFAEYGIANPRPDAYEVDYLITPELGGATSLGNLWPQPYHNTAWDARVKDQLEERLHAMVCNGEIDLATAQHDIATNWIAAYKKYFHTQKPLDGRPRAQNRQPEPRPGIRRLVRAADAASG